jgi:hypothetical protein
MKLSVIALSASVTSLALVASACGTNEDSSALGHSQPPPETTVTPPAPAAPSPRTLVEGNALPTSPVNLIADPGFGLSGQQAGFGSFLAFDEETFAQVELASTVDSRSPAGFGGSVALVRPEDATNKKSAPVLLLTSFQGGAGPFHATVWVSRSDIAGKPTSLGIDSKGIVASIADGTPEGEAFDLTPVDGASRVAGGRTWTLLRADITKPLAYGGFFIVHTGTGGGQFHIAAPQIVAQPLVDGLASTRSLSSSLRSRRVSTAERTAILRYKSKPPQLTPAR